MAALDKLTVDINAVKAANDQVLVEITNLKVRLADRLVDPAQVAALDNLVLAEKTRLEGISTDLRTIAPGITPPAP